MRVFAGMFGRAVATGLVVAVSGVGCGPSGDSVSAPVNGNEECRVLRGIALSEQKSSELRVWVQSILDDPQALAASGEARGALFADALANNPSWEALGVPASLAMVEFHGESVDYRKFDRDKVEAVIVGYGPAHLLVFKRRPEFSTRAFLEGSGAGAGRQRVEQVGADVDLVCMKRRDEP